MCRLSTSNPIKSEGFQAGTLTKNYAHWCDIGANQEVLSWLKNGVKIPFATEPDCFYLPNHTLSFKQSEFVKEELKTLVHAGAIERCSTPPKCISPLGIVPKKGGKLRLITDMRKLNSYMNVPKFQYEDIQTVTNLIQKDDLLITLDISNGFHHIQIAEQDRDKLGIFFKGHYYRWKVAPFGFAVSPLLFCKTVRPVVQYLRAIQVTPD